MDALAMDKLQSTVLSERSQDPKGYIHYNSICYMDILEEAHL